MNIAITFRQMEATEAVKSHATEKVAKLQKFLKQPMMAHVTLSCEKGRVHCVEVDVRAGADHFHAHERSEDMYASLDLVIGQAGSSGRGKRSRRSPRSARGRTAPRSIF